MNIYFARHGESRANQHREISNRGLVHPLTLTGRSQAKQLAERLRGASIVHIYSSPLLRAIETTVIVADLVGAEYEIVEALREYDCGAIEGRSDDDAWRRWRELYDSWTKHHRHSFRIEGGESFDDLGNRFVPFIEALVRERNSREGNVLCISHGGLYRMMLPRVMRNIDDTFVSEHSLGYTEYVVTEPDSTGLRCVTWNGCEP